MGKKKAPGSSNKVPSAKSAPKASVPNMPMLKGSKGMQKGMKGRVIS